MMTLKKGAVGPFSRLLSSSRKRSQNSLGSNANTHKKTGSATLLSSDHASESFMSLKDIPGPKPSVPFIGTAWQYFPGARYNLSSIHEACADKFARYGPVVREEFQWRKPVVHLYSPEDFERVCIYQGKYPVRPVSEFVKHYRENNPEKYDTVGLANNNGKEWSKLRQILGPVLLNIENVEGIYENVNSICDDFVELLRSERDQESNCVGHVQDMLYKLSLEGIYMMSLDTRLGCLKKNLNPNSPAASMITSVKLLFEAFQELFYGLPIWKLYATEAYKKMDTAESIMYDATNNRIQEVFEQLRLYQNHKGPPVKSEKSHQGKCPVKHLHKMPGVLQTLINSKDLTDKERRVTVIDFISGGIFTVTNAFSFLLYHISRNPEAQETLYRELKEKLGPDGDVTEDNISSLRYLKACVKESFRVTPTIPSLTRILPDDITIQGYHIPAGVPIFLNYTVPCMQSERFPEPERFYPERWMRRGPTPFMLMPFGLGARMCIGRRFAELEMYTALAKLVYNFKLESTGQEIKCKQAFIVVPSHPISIIFKDRKEC